MKTEEIKQHFDEIAEFGQSYLDELTPYIINKVLKYSDDVRRDCLRLIYNLINGNPGYPYPEEYLPNRLIEYWQERDTTFQKADKVYRLIEARLSEGQKPGPAEAKQFDEYLKVKNNKAFAEALRDEFKGSKGLDIRYMIEALKLKGILFIPARGKKAFFTALSDFFASNVGTYQAIFNPKDEDLFKPDIDTARKRIEFLLNNTK